MNSTQLSQSKVKKIVSEIQQHHKSAGGPVALNELPLWKPLTKSKKIKMGRGFKKMVVAGEIDGIKFAGVRKDNHSTYMPAGVVGNTDGGGFIRYIRKLFS